MARRGPAIIGLDELNKTFSQLGKLFGPTADVTEHLAAGGMVLQDAIQDNLFGQDLIDTLALVESIEVVAINNRQVNVQTTSPYSAAHEFGVTVEITERQRRFFWVMHAETGDDMWKALALSETYTIPERAYWRPAVDSEQKRIGMAVAKSMLLALLKFRRK